MPFFVTVVTGDLAEILILSRILLFLLLPWATRDPNSLGNISS